MNPYDKMKVVRDEDDTLPKPNSLSAKYLEEPLNSARGIADEAALIKNVPAQ